MNDFARRLLDWWTRHGRHDLPWQHPREPYRVWVAEIMLQQTRVSTVIPYFRRFMARFPSLPDLAAADTDTVLAHWSGLGYYARARNLHQAARVCMSDHGGRLPADRETLQGLPGIGRSTAAAILAQAFDQPEAILDGNAKRVLARHAGIRGWPGRRAVEKALWETTEARMPGTRAADYTQALMDLGSTICVRRRPQCTDCPVQSDCVALHAGRIAEIPAPRPKRDRPRRRVCMALLRDRENRVLLIKRPPAGIWGGLWSLPQANDPDTLKRDLPAAHDWQRAGNIEHGFTHFILHAEIHTARLQASVCIQETEHRWTDMTDMEALALPAPIRQVLGNL